MNTRGKCKYLIILLRPHVLFITTCFSLLTIPFNWIEVFARTKSENRAAFIPYLSGGYPSKSDTVPLLLALEKAGADIIELGVPFSDPMADGGIIEKANYDALLGGVTLVDCFGFIKEARRLGLKVPIVLMGYANPFYKHGDEASVKDAKEAGAQGFIVVDLPVEEASVFTTGCSTFILFPC